MSPERTKPAPRQEQAAQVEWVKLLDEALHMPPGAMSSYSRFYDYSMLNKLLLHMQGVEEPVATYKRWLDMGRQVKRGSKAKSILRPIAYKEVNDQGVEESKVRGFKMVKCLFGASETEGEPLPEWEPQRNWDTVRAVGALGLRMVQFDELNGNVMGFSYDNNIAINPVAPYPVKTLVHEMGHIVLGHTSQENIHEYKTHRGIKEFQAETTAYLVLHDVGATEYMDKGESRAYIQNWLGGEAPPDLAIRQVFTATDKILKAGRPAKETSNDPA